MPSKIKSIEFGILSPEFIKAISRVRVVSSELYNPDGYPVEGGVMDSRLGVIDPGLHCRTCTGSIGDCLGHFGYLELAKPVIHVFYTKLIYQLLKFICWKCNRIMKDDGTFLERNIATPTKCPHCKEQQQKITFVKPYTFYEDKKELSPLEVRERFEKIPDSDLKKVGLNGGRPEWLIITLFPIPPVTVRPSITLEGGERSEDDLTHKLVDIVRINQSLKENLDIGAPEFILKDLWELVQYHISTYFDNELTGTPLARHRSGRALKGIIQRLKAKEGRIRGNLLGKRVNFSARTVITPDPKISINEVGVPDIIAKELTIPIHVTSLNIKYIKELIKTDKINYIIRPDERKIKLTSENKSDLLSSIDTGWKAERQLQNGDVVLFNRQPSLHRMSIMAHKIVTMPHKSFRMNPSVCFPYNADFDGDEMNLHVIQNEEARSESEMLMDVQNNIISPKFGGPIIGLELDQISGIFLLTKKDTILNKEDATQILSNAGIDIELPNKDEFTGKEIFSLLLPKELSISFDAYMCKKLDLTEKEKKDYDALVIIENGILKSGAIDKSAIGTEEGKIIAEIVMIWEPEKVKEFVDNCGRLGTAFLMYRGISIGISDLDVPSNVRKIINNEIEKAQDNANKLIKEYEKKEIKILPGMTAEESFEAQIMNILSSGISNVTNIITENMPRSDIITMAISGAKGSMVNITQMSAVIGQETILGKRIKRGYLGRTLSHIKRKDLSPMSHGFVSRGFKQGLTPFELFWNIMNGREGLMDKSLRTRKSGYMQRRLINALQDLKVMNDLTVRNSANEVIQFFVGEDGIDPVKSHYGKLYGGWRHGN